MFFDTHNHFDDPLFAPDRLTLVGQASDAGIQQMVMTGITAQTFKRMVKVQDEINPDNQNNPNSDSHSTENHKLITHLAFGLHPLFIAHHQESDLDILEAYISKHQAIAIGEVGLDTFTPEMKQAENYNKQKYFFQHQLDLAVKHQRPVLLHIRKAHADSLQILKHHDYNAHELGGIAHSFSGGEQEAKAFVKQGFKLGVTGQICNPNAKKLRKAVQSAVSDYGLSCLVVETDCPDMTPITVLNKNTPHTENKQVEASQEVIQKPIQSSQHPRNTPANLIYVIDALSKLLQVDRQLLSEQLWQNSFNGLKLD